MNTSSRLPAREWWLLAALLLLAIIPSIAGGARLGDAVVSQVTAENARFVAALIPIVLHIVGTATLAFLTLGVVAIRRRRFAEHGAWMIRAYGLAMGAGTQVRTAGLPLVIFGPPDEPSRAITMIAGWALNAAIAEVIIVRRRVRSGPGAPEHQKVSVR
ncbi:DUF2306 domain-containing protein [Microbacterium amylolyticum]|uniref:DUF2306 domain-containing protein n=1 Tax=Microbacterium amylolyticum TaxID=936337 RepID=A0ABS4ZII1_9MICO|nr:DUF2306 domain-containing protein [Microbacterium amylolyticum]MBP2436863.1 hypothetical protein [Microbacterium amylolyticum]